jgi:hypothetical protein
MPFFFRRHMSELTFPPKNLTRPNLPLSLSD